MLTLNNELTGYLVKPKDMVGLRNQIEYCLANINELQEKANKAKDKAFTEYSTKAVMKRFVNIWNE